MAKNRKKKGPKPRVKIDEEALKKEEWNTLWLTLGIIAGIIILIVVLTLIISNSPKEEASVNSSPESSAQSSVQSSEESSVQSSEESTELKKASDYETSLDLAKMYYADIDIQDYGKITVELDPKTAPRTVENFVSLAESGFYDGLTFHRIMKDFMMQGGDPEGTGNGGSSSTIIGEFTNNGYENSISHTRGTISMARNTISMDSASSQFFIVHQDSTFLDGSYAAFGHVTEGMEIVDKICEEAEPTDDNGTIEKDKQPVINSIKIRTE